MHDEITSLNVDDLDVEELEHRLELAVVAPLLFDWCNVNIPCGVDVCGVRGCGCNADR